MAFEKTKWHTFERVETFFAWLCGASIAFTMLFVAVDVIARFVLKTSIAGFTYELVSMLTVIVGYLPLAYTMRQKSHVTMTVLTIHLKGRVKYIFDMWVNLFCIAFFAVLIYVTFSSGFLRAFSTKELVYSSLDSKIYLWYGKICQPIGLLIIFVTAITLFIDSLYAFLSFGKNEMKQKNLKED